MTVRFAAFVAVLMTVLTAAPAGAQTATPAASPSASGVTATPTPAPVVSMRTATALATSPAVATPAAPALPTGTPIPIGAAAPQGDEPESVNAGVPAPAAPVVRAFRTPERAAAPAFVAPRGAPPEAPAADVDAGGGMPAPAPLRPSRSGTRTVVFHAVARTALEGIDLLVTYPLDAGGFVGSGEHVDCTKGGGGGTLILNDHDDGTMRIMVASGQPLGFPLDVTCRFAVAAGAGIDGRDIGVRVGEVTVNGARGDPSLLSVGVDVR